MAGVVHAGVRGSTHADRKPKGHPINGFLIFATPISAVLAGAVQVGDLSPHAITSVLVGVSGLLGLLALRGRTNPVARAVLLVSIVWIIVTIMHLAFRGIPLTNEVTIAVSGFAILFGLAIMQGTRETFRAFAGGWVVAYCLSGAAGLAERYLGFMARNNYLVGQRGYLAEDVGITSFFGNPNGFALFLVASSIVFFPFIVSAKRTGARAFFLLLQLSTIYFMLETNSRTGLTLLLVVLAVTYWYVLGKHPVLRVLVILVVASAVATRWLVSLDTITVTSASGVVDDESVAVRLNLALNGLVFLMDNPLIGIGPGMFEEFMMAKNPPFPTATMINPHNGFAELLSQYGVIVFALMVAVFLLLWRGARRDMKRASGNRDLAYVSGVARLLLIGFLPLSATMQSTFLGDPSAWLYLAAIIAFDRLFNSERTRDVGPRHFRAQAAGSSSHRAPHLQ